MPKDISTRLETDRQTVSLFRPLTKLCPLKCLTLDDANSIFSPSLLVLPTQTREPRLNNKLTDHGREKFKSCNPSTNPSDRQTIPFRGIKSPLSRNMSPKQPESRMHARVRRTKTAIGARPLGMKNFPGQPTETRGQSSRIFPSNRYRSSLRCNYYAWNTEKPIANAGARIPSRRRLSHPSRCVYTGRGAHAYAANSFAQKGIRYNVYIHAPSRAGMNFK